MSKVIAVVSNTTSATSILIPSSIKPGDLLVLNYIDQSHGSAFSAPGFTRIVQDTHLGIAYKIADANDIGRTVSCSMGSATKGLNLVALRGSRGSIQASGLGNGSQTLFTKNVPNQGLFIWNNSNYGGAQTDSDAGYVLSGGYPIGIRKSVPANMSIQMPNYNGYSGTTAYVVFDDYDNVMPDKPTINEYSMEQASPTLTGNIPRVTWGFTDNNIGDTQSAYEIELHNITNNVYPFKGVIAGSGVNWEYSSTLAPSMLYSVRVRVKDNNGQWSEWSELKYFKTSAAPQKPTITAPSSIEPDAPSLLSTLIPTFTYDFTDADGDVLKAITVIITKEAQGVEVYNQKIDTDLLTWTVPEGVLEVNQKYSIKVRQRDQYGVWSEMSDLKYFIVLYRYEIEFDSPVKVGEYKVITEEVKEAITSGSLINSITQYDEWKITRVTKKNTVDLKVTARAQNKLKALAYTLEN